MSYRNDRFNQRMASLEVIVSEFADASKAKAFSDCGTGVERMLLTMDYSPATESKAEAEAEQRREERLFEAEMRLAEAGKRHLIPVLLLIVENGSNREESLKKVPRRTYFLHRKQLLVFFGCTLLH